MLLATCALWNLLSIEPDKQFDPEAKLLITPTKIFNVKFALERHWSFLAQGLLCSCTRISVHAWYFPVCLIARCKLKTFLNFHTQWWAMSHLSGRQFQFKQIAVFHSRRQTHWKGQVARDVFLVVNSGSNITKQLNVISSNISTCHQECRVPASVRSKIKKRKAPLQKGQHKLGSIQLAVTFPDTP